MSLRLTQVNESVANLGKGPSQYNGSIQLCPTQVNELVGNLGGAMSRKNGNR